MAFSHVNRQFSERNQISGRLWQERMGPAKCAIFIFKVSVWLEPGCRRGHERHRHPLYAMGPLMNNCPPVTAVETGTDITLNPSRVY